MEYVPLPTTDWGVTDQVSEWLEKREVVRFRITKGAILSSDKNIRKKVVRYCITKGAILSSDKHINLNPCGRSELR